MSLDGNLAGAETSQNGKQRCGGRRCGVGRVWFCLLAEGYRYQTSRRSFVSQKTFVGVGAAVFIRLFKIVVCCR